MNFNISLRSVLGLVARNGSTKRDPINSTFSPSYWCSIQLRVRRVAAKHRFVPLLSTELLSTELKTALISVRMVMFFYALALVELKIYLRLKSADETTPKLMLLFEMLCARRLQYLPSITIHLCLFFVVVAVLIMNTELRLHGHSPYRIVKIFYMHMLAINRATVLVTLSQIKRSIYYI